MATSADMLFLLVNRQFSIISTHFITGNIQLQEGRGKYYKIQSMAVSTMTILISTTSTTAKKIMEVFQYFRIKQSEYISLKLIMSKRHLWRDIEEEEITYDMFRTIKAMESSNLVM